MNRTIFLNILIVLSFYLISSVYAFRNSSPPPSPHHSCILENNSEYINIISEVINASTLESIISDYLIDMSELANSYCPSLLKIDYKKIYQKADKDIQREMRISFGNWLEFYQNSKTIEKEKLIALDNWLSSIKVIGENYEGRRNEEKRDGNNNRRRINFKKLGLGPKKKRLFKSLK